MYIGVHDTSPQLIDNSLVTLNADRLPVLNPVIENDKSKNSVPGLWQNLNHITKIVGVDAYNSNYFSQLSLLTSKKYRRYFNRILSNPYVYLTDDVLSCNEFLADTSNRISANTLLVSNEDYKGLGNFQLSEGDTVITTKFSPAGFAFRTKTKQPVMLSLLQSHYVGWKVYVDGKEQPIYKTNTFCMGVAVPSGECEVVFKYDNNFIKTMAFISYLSFGLVVFLLSIYYIRRNKQNWVYVIVVWGVPLIIVLRYFFFVV